MNSNEIRTRFLKFFEKRGHKVIPSASLVTSDEKGVTNSTLFNTAGMQPLISYLLGKSHPEGKRLANSQKCVRTVDIDDIGDKTHATFFEMLGNWSLGDYFKNEAINWSFELLTDKSEGLGLNPENLYVTVFEGDENAPKDEDAVKIWREIFKKAGVEGERIFYLPAKNNWWEAGDNGPCGPDSEMYYDVKNKFGGKGITKEEFIKADEARDVVEVWNNVFMQYEKKAGKVIGKLKSLCVDTGAGLERLAMVSQGVDNIYDTDLLKPVMDEINKFSNSDDLKSKRIVGDHIRTAVFLIGDGVIPGNTDRGYVLRRLLRRAIRLSVNLGIPQERIGDLVKSVINKYKEVFPELGAKSEEIINAVVNEDKKFRLTLGKGLKEFEKIGKEKISGKDAFILFSTYGFPIELTLELAKEIGIEVDVKAFEEEMKKHQELSKVGAEKKFKGGLAGGGEMETKYHTATHLLHQALRDVLGLNVMQKGSNITAERLRFDFTHGAKMTDDEKKKVENIVNEKIQAKLPVNKVVLSVKEAEKTGALHFFGEKYGDEVSVYFTGENLDTAYSKEFCGGPHVKNTGELGRFKISKEEAVSAGVRRIKAVLE